MKTYRFFYHYFKAKKKMSIHFKNTCTVVDDIVCNVPAETKWKKQQPYLVMQGFCKDVEIVNNKAIIK